MSPVPRHGQHIQLTIRGGKPLDQGCEGLSSNSNLDLNTPCEPLRGDACPSTPRRHKRKAEDPVESVKTKRPTYSVDEEERDESESPFEPLTPPPLERKKPRVKIRDPEASSPEPADQHPQEQPSNYALDQPATRGILYPRSKRTSVDAANATNGDLLDAWLACMRRNIELAIDKIPDLLRELDGNCTHE